MKSLEGAMALDKTLLISPRIHLQILSSGFHIDLPFVTAHVPGEARRMLMKRKYKPVMFIKSTFNGCPHLICKSPKSDLKRGIISSFEDDKE